jgi:hypothetical protein
MSNGNPSFPAQQARTPPIPTAENTQKQRKWKITTNFAACYNRNVCMFPGPGN